MDIVVTKNKVDYSSRFLKVSTLEGACQVVGTIDVLIYNNSNESEEKKIECLGKLKDRVKKLVYICNERSTSLAIKMMVIGSDGKYFDDEFFLESSSELANLIESLDEVTAIASLGGVNVLSDFFNRYLKDGSGSADFNKNYLCVVKEAVNTLMSEYNQKNLEILQMSETATDIFSNTSALLSSMKKEKDNMQELVERMSNRLKEPSTVIPRTNSSVLFYPRVSYMKERSIIRIKEIGSFKFLVSFMLGFRVYLENVKNLRPKLIVLEPVGGNIETRYQEYSWVKTSTSKSKVNYYNDVVFTNCPSKEVLETLLDDTDYDTFIVLDRTVSDKDHLLNCKGGTVKYAIGGVSCITKFKLSKRDCITNMIEIPGTLCNVPLFPSYPNDKAARERFYMSEMSSAFDKLLLDLRRK